MQRAGEADPAAQALQAAQQGNARTALAQLETMLAADPRRDDVRVQMATVYWASGSPTMASLYARQALENPNLDPALAGRARQIVADAERAISPSVFDVSLFAGARWDSNANGVTPTGAVSVYTPVPGGYLVLPAQLPASGEASWSSVLAARVGHRYDLGLQREASWETNASLFDQRFASIPRQYDLSIATFDSGPRIGIMEIGESGMLSVRPSVRAGWIGYADSTYSWQYGAGLSAELRLPRWTFEVSGQFGFGNYMNSDFRPTARLYTGSEMILNAGVSYRIDSDTTITGTMSYFEGNARVDYYARTGWGAFLGAQTAFAIGTYTIGATARIGARTAGYEAPDPVLNPFTKRRDTRWEGGAALIFPIARSVAITVEYDAYNQNSNYEAYSFDDHAFTVGLRVAL